jgi:nitronate monooxygenase
MFKQSVTFANSLELKWPAIIQAPMAGGITTPALVAAVAESGGLGSFATGYLTGEAIVKGITDIQSLTTKPFSANVFVPSAIEHYQPSAAEAYVKTINRFRLDLGLEAIKAPESPAFFKDNFQEMIDILMDKNIKTISFAFGIPSSDIIEKLKSRGTYLIGTANSVEEAKILEESGLDAIVAQGYEAGGHRGGFLTPSECSAMSTFALLPQVVRAVKCPVIAAGGIMDGKGVVASLALGASAVQLGTAFLSVEESGASKTYKEELEKVKTKDCDVTVVTRAYTGKLARGLRTKFSERIEAEGIEIPHYPIAHYLSTELRKQAAALGHRDVMAMWCGQGVQQIRSGISASTLLEEIRNELRYVVDELK